MRAAVVGGKGSGDRQWWFFSSGFGFVSSILHPDMAGDEMFGSNNKPIKYKRMAIKTTKKKQDNTPAATNITPATTQSKGEEKDAHIHAEASPVEKSVSHSKIKMKKEKINTASLSYRSSLQAIIILLRTTKFTYAHLKVLKKTPFWTLIHALMRNSVDLKKFKKTDTDVLTILRTFDIEKQCFNIGPKSIQLTTNEVKLIFGIRCGSQHLDSAFVNKADIGLVRRRSIKSDRLNAPEIKKLIETLITSNKKEDVEDIARLVCIFICLNLFFSTTGHHIAWSYAHYMEDLKQTIKYDWATAIRTRLFNSIDKYFYKPQKITGCVMVLLYWFCEHTNIMKPDDTIMRPRLMRWALQDLHKKIIKMPLDSLKDNEVKVDEITATEEETLAYNINKNCEDAKEESSTQESEDIIEENDDVPMTLAIQERCEEVGRNEEQKTKEMEGVRTKLFDKNLERENERLQKENEELNEPVLHLRNVLTNVFEKKDTEVKNLHGQINGLSTKFVLKDDEIERLNEELENLHKANEQMDEVLVEHVVHNVTQREAQLSSEKKKNQSFMVKRLNIKKRKGADKPEFKYDEKRKKTDAPVDTRKKVVIDSTKMLKEQEKAKQP